MLLSQLTPIGCFATASDVLQNHPNESYWIVTPLRRSMGPFLQKSETFEQLHLNEKAANLEIPGQTQHCVLLLSLCLRHSTEQSDKPQLLFSSEITQELLFCFFLF